MKRPSLKLDIMCLSCPPSSLEPARLAGTVPCGGVGCLAEWPYFSSVETKVLYSMISMLCVWCLVILFYSVSLQKVKMEAQALTYSVQRALLDIMDLWELTEQIDWQAK